MLVFRKMLRTYLMDGPLQRYTGHHVPNKDRILENNPIPCNIKKTPILENYIKELLVENRKKITINHEDARKNIREKINNVFGRLLCLWQ